MEEGDCLKATVNKFSLPSPKPRRQQIEYMRVTLLFFFLKGAHQLFVAYQTRPLKQEEKLAVGNMEAFTRS